MKLYTRLKIAIGFIYLILAMACWAATAFCYLTPLWGLLCVPLTLAGMWMLITYDSREDYRKQDPY